MSSDYKLKSKVIENGLAKIQRDVSLTLFRYNQSIRDNQEYYMPMEYQQALNIQSFMQDTLEWKEAYRVNDASYHRVIRLKKRIRTMLNSGNCIFLTLTFTNDVLESTTKETRRRYVARYLKQYSNKYVANIDYGAKNEREHYHAVILVDSVNHSDWKYGAINFERIRYTNSDIEKDTETIKKVSKYVSKLTNHAIKETTQRNYMIFSRN